jgi:hypothetical protein
MREGNNQYQLDLFWLTEAGCVAVSTVFEFHERDCGFQ